MFGEYFKLFRNILKRLNGNRFDGPSVMGHQGDCRIVGHQGVHLARGMYLHPATVVGILNRRKK